MYFDLVRARLRRSFPLQPRKRAKAERAIFAIMNADIQAIVEAFGGDGEMLPGTGKIHEAQVDGAHSFLADPSQNFLRTHDIPPFWRRHGGVRHREIIIVAFPAAHQRRHTIWQCPTWRNH